VIEDSLDNQLISTESSLSLSSSSSSSSISGNQFPFETYLPFVTNKKTEQLNKFQRLLSYFKKMSTKTLLPPSSYINERYFFHSQPTNTRISLKNKLDDTSSSQKKRHKYSSTYNEQYPDIYKFPINQYEKRSHSSDSDRYYFPSDNTQQTLAYLRSGSGYEQRSVTFNDGSSTFISDAPYSFSRATKSQRYPTTTSTFIYPEGKIIIPAKLSTVLFYRYMDISTSSTTSKYRFFN
jgi:hypothetical protein